MSNQFQLNSSFRRALTRFTASLTSEEEADFKFTTLTDVQEVLGKIQDEQGARKKMMNLHRIQIFLEGMEQFGEVIKVFLNTSPLVAFIWGPVKFLLLVASTFAESFDTLLDAYEQIGENIPQFLQYQTLFHHNARMREVLELLYVDILEFHRRALKFFKRRTWQQLFLSAWKDFRSRFQGILDSLKRHKALIESQATLVEFEESQAARALAEDRYLRKEENERKTQLITVRTWLKGLRSHIDQKVAMSERAEYPETGRWLLNYPKLKIWFDIQSSEVRILWINGIPGAGKTILASLIIEEVQKISAINVAFFYCKYKNSEKDTFLAVARDLLAQLLQQNPDLLPYLYEKCSASGELVLESLDLAQELLGTVLRSMEKAYIIIDGVDECDRGERKKILSWFTSVIQAVNEDSPGTLKGLFISQDEGDIRKLLSKASIITLRPQDNQGDIESYASYWSLKIQHKFDLSAATGEDVASKISERAKGMFLYAKLVLTNLYSQPNQEYLNAELDPSVLPSGLDQAYERIVCRIFGNSSNSEKEVAVRLLGWIVCAKRPFKGHEIQGAMSIGLSDFTVDFEKRRLRVDLKDLYGSLVQVHSDGTIELVHMTARLYLIKSNHVCLALEESRLASLCLQYLSFDCFDAQILDEDIRRFLLKGYYSFLDYAILHWIDHLECGIQCSDQDRRQNLDPLVEVTREFLRKHWADSPTPCPIPTEIAYQFRALEGYDISNKLLQLASFKRRTKMLDHDKLMEDDPLSLNLKLQRIRSVFEKLITSLPSEGLEQHMFRLFYGPNWFKCPRRNCVYFHEGFPTSQLRDQHLNKHARPFFCSFTGCHMAEFGCGSARELKKHMAGFHSRVQDTNWKFPTKKPRKIDMFAAAKKGNLGEMQQLLENGEDLSQKTPRRRLTVLHVAAKADQREMMQLLLECGAVDPASRNKKGQTALWIAAAEGHNEVVQLLLEKDGVDPGTQNDSGETPLWIAAERGHHRVVQLLLEKDGVDPEVRDNYDRTPLWIAAANGRNQVVQLLLEKDGIDPESRNGHGETPLRIAVAGGYYEVV